MAANRALARAKARPRDEYYTAYGTVAAEVAHYEAAFAGRRVYLSCDDPRRSAFCRYFSDNFERLGLLHLCATGRTPNGGRRLDVWRGRGGAPARAETALSGDGDFRSPECVRLLDFADVVVTNPPFSLFREMWGLLLGHGVGFLVMAPMSALTYKDVFPTLVTGQARTGHSSGTMEFGVPREYDPSGRARLGNVCWLTNLPGGSPRPPLPLARACDGRGYATYDNLDAIEVPRLADIPSGHDGLMGVPVTYLVRHCPAQFEIAGMDDGAEWAERLGVGEIGREWLDRYRTQGGTARLTPGMRVLTLTVDGVARLPYKRVLIRRRVRGGLGDMGHGAQ